MTQGRLHGRIRGMGQNSNPSADPATAGQPGRHPRAGTPAAGTASPGGTPQSNPTGLAPASGTASPAAAAVTTPNGGGAASPPGPQEMPMQAVIVGPTGNEYVTLGSVELQPLFTADGAAIPATTPGRWAQLRAAGRA